MDIIVPGFPNLFCLFRPNTKPNTSNIFLTLESQSRNVSKCLMEMIELGRSVVECRQNVCDEYDKTMDVELASMAWSHPDARSYFNNSEGRVITNMSWKALDYCNMIKEPDLSELEFSKSSRDDSS